MIEKEENMAAWHAFIYLYLFTYLLIFLKLYLNQVAVIKNFKIFFKAELAEIFVFNIFRYSAKGEVGQVGSIRKKQLRVTPTEAGLYFAVNEHNCSA